MTAWWLRGLSRREAVRAVAAVDDDTRHGVYQFVRAAGSPVTREEVAAGCGISRNLAAFHLDKLVAVGLVASRYDAERRAHKVGRAPKVYHPSDLEIQVSFPERHPAVLADILVEAVAAEGPGPAYRTALRLAEERGRELGREAAAAAVEGRDGAELAFVEAALRERGFEPYRAGADCLRLRNCPFHAQAGRAPELVCALNHRLLVGLLDGAGAAGTAAVVAPRPAECCVELRAVED